MRHWLCLYNLPIFGLFLRPLKRLRCLLGTPLMSFIACVILVICLSQRCCLPLCLLCTCILLFQIGNNVVNGLCICVLGESLNHRKRGLFQIHLVLFAAKHSLVVNQNLIGESLQNPFMLQSFQRGHPIYRVPIKTLVDEIDELCVLTLPEHILKGFRVGQSASSSRICDNNWIELVFLKEEIPSWWQLDDVLSWNTLDFHHISKLLSFVFTWK